MPPVLRRILVTLLCVFGGSTKGEVAGANAVAVNSQEQAVFELMAGDSDQRRATMRLDPTLCRVARARAADMASRGYFNHTDPDGHGPNWWVERAGYDLPADYSQSSSANNVESLAAGQTSASSAWNSWMGSSAHSQHVLGTNSFYAAQTSVGIGYVADAGSDYKHYWVVISAPPSGPEIRMESPAANARLTLAEVTLSGTTSGLPAPAAVQVALGNGPWRSAVGTRDWTAQLAGLEPGENALRVRSLNANGGVLDEASRTVRYVVSVPLTVQVSGPGSVSENFNGTTQREVGREYTIVATPSQGSVFNGWTGSFAGTARSLTFTMTAGASITANFVANPFAGSTGKYIGLFAAGTVHGQLKVKLGETGAFTAKVRYNGLKVALRGQLDGSGAATASVQVPDGTTLNLALRLESGGGSPRITGAVSNGTFSAPFSIAAVAAGSTTHAGRYTVVIPALSDTSSVTPDGDGIGSIVVDASGVARFSGVLAEGTKVLASGVVSPEGTLDLYVPLYENAGLLTGTINFRATNTSDGDGAFFWSKPTQPGALACPAAFALQTSMIASRYTPPAPGVRVLAVSASTNNTSVALGEGGLAVQLIQPTTLAQDNTVAVSAPVIDGLSVVVKSNSGRFTGSFVHPTTGAVTPFRGVIFQKQNAGFGFFIGSEKSGYTSFAPAGATAGL